ncbi:MAG: 30S ribosomal protein S17 [Candidatus Komeilibacteria bacterium CG11_big_fil_rev_8_21_14_0_20_36_20]|uniref:Small ribosomal subunit protein uS17 n=1 Tax=Candidatus Komeilibacteria bacterium CG11_big_fil_rev_8_21_14_0_20_36_20 TaxID=1974477 RepID=A0A2H0NG24_9BACT|nr:MAG: 30S ribosomal protein S17 [Candidatus Komeilibacteria bacterium CG11_big_fil_rev_8_21_14_0_20_36_20]PIR81397.1 MAG: 30S ribosomal protein S17 [Candidatus Komeilibacteria bacterium CG10_big_fil_rev_8_21_14_0_10_36_65]PJC55122.1 MAG: 30S ribosomal protein S17 [Candidatus Komeilibacteria bacterium CG_4_9_14_0_2_um_filter_36_13]
MKEQTIKRVANKRKLEGEVVNDKMDKTVVVQVINIKIHSKYNKRYKSSKKYKAHDEKNEYKAGDKVVIQQCRPLSADKRWRVVSKLKSRKQKVENI